MLRLARRGLAPAALDDVAPVASAEDLRAARAEVDATEVSDEVVGYVVAIVRRTRELPSVALGASPRAAVHLLGAAKAAARLAGRAYVTPDDVARMAAAGPAPPPRPHAGGRARARDARRRDPRRARGRPGAAMTCARPRRAATPVVTPAPRSHRARGHRAGRAARPLGLVALAARRRSSPRPSSTRRAAERRPQVERQAAEVLSRGVPAHAEDRARRRPPAGRVRVRQAAPPALDDRAARGRRRRSTATIVARRRGRHTLPARRDPRDRAARPRALGPPRAARTPSCASSPTCTTARRLALAVARGRFRDQGATARGPLGLGTEFELIRDYQPDDDIRQVNWRATARLGRPMSNQYRLEQDRDLLLLLDAGRLSARAAGRRHDRARRLRSTPRPRSRSSPTSSATAPAPSPSTTRSATALKPRRAGGAGRRARALRPRSRARSTATTSSPSAAPRAPSARSSSSSATCSRRPPRARSSTPCRCSRAATRSSSPARRDPALAALAATRDDR